MPFIRLMHLFENGCTYFVQFIIFFLVFFIGIRVPSRAGIMKVWLGESYLTICETQSKNPDCKIQTLLRKTSILFPGHFSIIWTLFPMQIIQFCVNISQVVGLPFPIQNSQFWSTIISKSFWDLT